MFNIMIFLQFGIQYSLISELLSKNVQVKRHLILERCIMSDESCVRIKLTGTVPENVKLPNNQILLPPWFQLSAITASVIQQFS
jgi:hypothetical protein